jgi:two-component system chemotaxis response regulator CheV
MQLYAINVFKIVEVIECPGRVTKMPHSHFAVTGTINFRGRSIAVIDLSYALGMPAVEYAKKTAYVIVCDYYRSVHGFLIDSPNMLISKNWTDIKSPASFISRTAYLTALTYMDDDTAVQILDIEKVLSEIIGIDENLSEDMKSSIKERDMKDYHILVVDDSKTARTMMQTLLVQMGLTYTLMESATEALEILEHVSQDDIPATERFTMIISDIEMPGMDGYTFTRTLKANPRLSKLYVLLHSSLSNEASTLKATESGADDFLSKFNPDMIAERILSRIKAL